MAQCSLRQIAGLALTVEIAPHRRNRPRCASCGQASAVYDRLALRRFEFVPLWGLRVFFLYPMRRVDCPRCGVTVEPGALTRQAPADHHLHVVSRAVGQMPQLAGGRARLPHQLGPGVPVGRDGGGVGPRSRGSHRYSRDQHRRDPSGSQNARTRSTRRILLWIGQHRSCQDPDRFFRWRTGADRRAAQRHVEGEKSSPKAGHALHILDRFHIART